EQSREQYRVLVHGAGAVERIARVGEVGREPGDRLYRGIREGRQLDTDARGDVGHATALTAETAEHRDAPAGTAMPRESRHQRERVDHLVQTLDLDDPALIQHGADDLRRAGQRPRVRQHRLARVLRLADFQDDDRLSELARPHRGLPQLRGLPEAFDEYTDHARVLVVDEELHVILDADAGLVAAGNDVAD